MFKSSLSIKKFLAETCQHVQCYRTPCWILHKFLWSFPCLIRFGGMLRKDGSLKLCRFCWLCQCLTLCMVKLQTAWMIDTTPNISPLATTTQNKTTNILHSCSLISHFSNLLANFPSSRCVSAEWFSEEKLCILLESKYFSYCPSSNPYSLLND